MIQLAMTRAAVFSISHSQKQQSFPDPPVTSMSIVWVSTLKPVHANARTLYWKFEELSVICVLSKVFTGFSRETLWVVHLYDSNVRNNPTFMETSIIQRVVNSRQRWQHTEAPMHSNCDMFIDTLVDGEYCTIARPWSYWLRCSQSMV